MKIKQPDKYTRKELIDIISGKYDIVNIPDTNRRVKIYALHPYTLERLTKLWNERDISRPSNTETTMKELSKDFYFNHKLAALFVLNGFFKINLFFSFLWRWYAYIRGYKEYQLTEIINTAKKKLPLIEYYRNIILTLDMREDWMTMTEKEAEQYQAELISAVNTHSLKNTLNTEKQDISSLD